MVGINTAYSNANYPSLASILAANIGTAGSTNTATTPSASTEQAATSITLSSIALNTGNKFTPEEVIGAASAMRAKGGAALLARFQSAAKSSDPTAFSQNIISIYSSMSAEERQAAGWSTDFYQAALSSYQSTAKLTQMLAEAGSSSTGFLGWLGK